MRMRCHNQTFANVRPLKQRDNNGHGGFGYGGDHLYVAVNVDCFDPPCYAIRADTWEDAYETAEASLAPTYERTELDPEEWAQLEAGNDVAGVTINIVGEAVNTEGLQLWQVR